MISSAHLLLSGIQNVNPVSMHSPPIMQGLSVPYACVGSGDPVRVLYTACVDASRMVFWDHFFLPSCSG